jgi:hypothetical protein
VVVVDGDFGVEGGGAGAVVVVGAAVVVVAAVTGGANGKGTMEALVVAGVRRGTDRDLVVGTAVNSGVAAVVGGVVVVSGGSVVVVLVEDVEVVLGRMTRYSVVGLW